MALRPLALLTSTLNSQLFLFLMFALYLDVRSPLTFLIEEVDTFANKTPQ